jgi:hypothetical protein
MSKDVVAAKHHRGPHTLKNPNPMNTLRITVISFLAAAAASASFAGPGIQYWSARRNPAPAATPATVATAPGKCETMIVNSGRRQITVECKGAIANTPKCKAMCGS